MRPLTVIATSVAVASAAAMGGYWLGHALPSHPLGQRSSTAILEEVESPEDNTKLAEAIKQLDRRVAALELRQLYAMPGERQAPDKAPHAGQAEHLDLAAMREQQLERAAALEATLHKQQRDSAWAPVTETQLRTAVDGAGKEGAEFSVKTLKCLTSICEMVLSAPSPDQLRHTSFQLDPRIIGMSGFAVSPPEIAADGSATVTYHLFREGYPRPDEGT